MNIDNFCKSLSVEDLQSLSDKDHRLCFEILSFISKKVATNENVKLHVYYLLFSYFKPVTISDYRPMFSVPVSLTEGMCRYLANNPLSENEIKLLYSTTYNTIVMYGLKTDISNINDGYLKKLFEVVDIVYFNNELAKWLESNSMTTQFECTDTLTNTAGVCRKMDVCTI
jgi:hypothetical protein